MPYKKRFFQFSNSITFAGIKLGGLAQLVERLHGMQEVIGSTPLSSTKIRAIERER
jgi:hypothetical protein